MSPPVPQKSCDQIFAPFRLDHARMLARIDELEAVVQARRDVLDDCALRDLLTEIERQFGTHMAAEDDALFPAMDAAFPEARGTLAPLRAEHAELRVLLGELMTTLGASPSSVRDVRIRIVARDFVDLIRLHIRKEELVVFQVACRVLTAADVRELERRLGAIPKYGQHAPPRAGDEPGAA